MLLRSLIATLLSIPATTAVLGVLLVLVPVNEGLLVSLLLLAFPAWVLMACGAYLVPRPTLSAALLIAISLAGFGLIALLKQSGVAGI